jgi:hypothetical protein
MNQENFYYKRTALFDKKVDANPEEMILAKKRTLEAYEELRDKFEKDAELIGKRFNNVVKE